MRDISNTRTLFVLLRKGMRPYKKNLYSSYKAVKCFLTSADGKDFLRIRGIEDEWEVIPAEIGEV